MADIVDWSLDSISLTKQLLKLSKPKLAKACKYKNISYSGNKKEMVHQLVNHNSSNKRKQKKHCKKVKKQSKKPSKKQSKKSVKKHSKKYIMTETKLNELICGYLRTIPNKSYKTDELLTSQQIILNYVQSMIVANEYFNMLVGIKSYHSENDQKNSNSDCYEDSDLFDDIDNIDNGEIFYVTNKNSAYYIDDKNCPQCYYKNVLKFYQTTIDKQSNTNINEYQCLNCKYFVSFHMKRKIKDNIRGFRWKLSPFENREKCQHAKWINERARKTKTYVIGQQNDRLKCPQCKITMELLERTRISKYYQSYGARNGTRDAVKLDLYKKRDLCADCDLVLVKLYSIKTKTDNAIEGNIFHDPMDHKDEYLGHFKKSQLLNCIKMK